MDNKPQLLSPKMGATASRTSQQFLFTTEGAVEYDRLHSSPAVSQIFKNQSPRSTTILDQLRQSYHSFKENGSTGQHLPFEEVATQNPLMINGRAIQEQQVRRSVELKGQEESKTESVLMVESGKPY